MGMSVGTGNGPSASINMTPMIDILLVLIIIFLVITPVEERGLRAVVPEQSNVSPPPDAIPHDLVVSVSRNNVIRINQDPVDINALPDRLATLRITARDAHFFVRGDRDLDFEDVAHVIDIARGAGWNQVGLMTR